MDLFYLLALLAQEAVVLKSVPGLHGQGETWLRTSVTWATCTKYKSLVNTEKY